MKEVCIISLRFYKSWGLCRLLSSSFLGVWYRKHVPQAYQPTKYGSQYTIIMKRHFQILGHMSNFCSTVHGDRISSLELPYHGKFSLVQIFVEVLRPDPSEEIFAVFIFTECGTLWQHPYRLMQHLQSASYGFVGILYSRRLTLRYSNQTVENQLPNWTIVVYHLHVDSWVAGQGLCYSI